MYVKEGNTMKYKLIIFDMDGTILYTLEDLTDCMNYALTENGLPERTMAEVKSFVGNGIRKLVERAVPDNIDEKTLDNTYESFKKRYRNFCNVKTRPYDGINELILELKEKGYLTAVVSNKADFAVQDLCKDYFPGLFDCAIGDREDIRKKPYPDGVELVLKTLGVAKEDAVYVGDSDVDFNTAKNANMDLIMVDWGFRERDYLESLGATRFISKPEDIYKYI